MVPVLYFAVWAICKPERIRADDGAPLDAPCAGFELTPEQEAGMETGLRSTREGRVVSLEEAHARMTAKLSALR